MTRMARLFSFLVPTLLRGNEFLSIGRGLNQLLSFLRSLLDIGLVRGLKVLRKKFSERYKIKEEAGTLSVHKKTVRRFMKEGKIKGIRTGGVEDSGGRDQKGLGPEEGQRQERRKEAQSNVYCARPEMKLLRASMRGIPSRDREEAASS